MHIREINPDTDQAAVKECLTELQEFSRAHDHRLPRAGAIADEYLARLYAQCQTQGGKIFVADANGFVVGYICVLAHVAATEPADGELAQAHIVDLVVKSHAQGLGAGGLLLDAAESFAQSQGADWLRVGVFAWNSHAIRVYEQRGFSRLEITLEKRLTATD